MRMRGFLTALFAGGLGLAVLAGPATCPTCDPAHADGQLDAKRILSRLTYTPGEAVELAAREAPPLDRADVPAVAERGTPPALSELALVEPQDTASSNAPISTAAIDPAPERVPDTAPATASQLPSRRREPRSCRKRSRSFPTRARRKPEIAAATVESEPQPPLPPVGSTTLPLKDVAVDPEEPAPRVQAAAQAHSDQGARRQAPREGIAQRRPIGTQALLAEQVRASSRLGREDVRDALADQGVLVPVGPTPERSLAQRASPSA